MMVWIINKYGFVIQNIFFFFVYNTFPLDHNTTKPQDVWCYYPNV
jgi:hypothetical protein